MATKPGPAGTGGTAHSSPPDEPQQRALGVRISRRATALVGKGVLHPWHRIQSYCPFTAPESACVRGFPVFAGGMWFESYLGQSVSAGQACFDSLLLTSLNFLGVPVCRLHPRQNAPIRRREIVHASCVRTCAQVIQVRRRVPLADFGSFWYWSPRSWGWKKGPRYLARSRRSLGRYPRSGRPFENHGRGGAGGEGGVLLTGRLLVRQAQLTSAASRPRIAPVELLAVGTLLIRLVLNMFRYGPPARLDIARTFARRRDAI
ncbi:hypothetical protein J2X98_004077 [Pseudarthrobacter enclensis]|uniref:Uncharacterized protein n=1 Tax=Pseudarthrobacter enclensis TaxID=993070 RepID=A0ABT9RYY5_9MICC|nr:hypothetical protein [Pseudarthrobacter enclensis]